LSAPAAGCDFSAPVHAAATRTLVEIREHMNTTYRPTQPSKSTRDYLADFLYGIELKLYGPKIRAQQRWGRQRNQDRCSRARPGDVLAVTRLDRLARSTRDLLNLLNTISERGSSFRSLRDTWADTTNAHGRLIISVLGGLAEFERELIRSRCGEGIVRAKERGVRFGRPPKLTPHQRKEARARLEAGETQSDIARSYNVDATTIGRLAR
jgi:DNA invertase Pin-like site-specific DNA recombinase